MNRPFITELCIIWSNGMTDEVNVVWCCFIAESCAQCDRLSFMQLNAQVLSNYIFELKRFLQSQEQIAGITG